MSRRLVLHAWSAALLVGVPSGGWGQSSQQRATWNRPAAPFRIIDNVYYVGTDGLSSFLITSPAGHVVIDGALPESAPLIAANIRRLGFRLNDVKYLLNNHSHVDHAGGLAELKRLTGAKLVASAGDKADLEAGRTIGRPELADFPSVKVDRVIADGEQVVLGPIRLQAMLTPGHTRGATTWSTTAAGHRIMFVSSLSVAGQRLVKNRSYPSVAGDFRQTFRKLRATRADIFLSYHAEGFGLEEKRARLRGGQRNAFIDRSELPRSVTRAEQAFKTQLTRDRQQYGQRPR